MADRQTELLEEILAEQKALRGDVQDLKQGQAETNNRLETVEQRLETVENGVGVLSVSLQNLDTKMEKKLDDQMEALKQLVGEAYDLHDERITTLEEEVGIKPRKH